MPEQSKNNHAQLAITIVRATGALLMLAGAAIGFNLGGVAETIGFGGTMQAYIGGAIFVAGLADFLIVPHILANSLGKGE